MAALGPADLAHGFLCLAPSLALALLVAFELYAGEEFIVSAASRRRRLARKRGPVAVPAPPCSDRYRAARGRLVGGQCGPRAPPLQRTFAKGFERTWKGIDVRKRTAVIAAGAALALPAAASAHVTLHPNNVPAGGFAVLNVRVPNEMDNANTTKVQLQLPDGFADASWQAVPGWKVTVNHQKLAQPIQTDDGPVNEEVKEITWQSSKGIPPGAFESFPLSVAMPDKAGTPLTFKALQTYSNGKIVRWIGAAGSDTPAPVVHVTAKDGVIQDSTAEGGALPPTAAAAPEKSSEPASQSGNAGASKGLAITALVVGILGLLAGLAALLSRRRGGGTSTELSRETT
jgi:uncharacterized protein